MYLKTVQNGNDEFKVRDDYPPEGSTTSRQFVDANKKRGIEQDFHLSTPWKFNVSLGYTVGRSLALGAEYEYEDY